jgi:hypothetical protein
MSHLPKRKAGAADAASAAGTAADSPSTDRKPKKAKAETITITDCNTPTSDARCRLLFYRVFVSNDPEPASTSAPLGPSSIEDVMCRHRSVLEDVRSSTGVLATMGELLSIKYTVQHVLEFLDNSRVEWTYFGGPLLSKSSSNARPITS